MKNALVMEGGAMRGMFTCGVIDVLMEEGLDDLFQGAAGISAGAVFGCNIQSKQIGRAIRYNKKWGRDPRYCSVRSLIKTGDLYGAEFCYKTLPYELDIFDRETFRTNPLKFYVGATDVHTGKIRYHLLREGDERDLKWLQASASMPFVSRVVEVDGYGLLDGGITDPVSYRYMKAKGYDRQVLILTQPKGYRKKKSKGQPMVNTALHKYPNVARAMERRYKVYNHQMEEIDNDEALGKILVIRPPESLGIKRTENDPDELERVYQIGRKEATRRLEEIRKYLLGE